MALERSVNLESNAFMGSILEGVLRTEGEEVGGTAEAEVAFTLSKERPKEFGPKHIHSRENWQCKHFPPIFLRHL